MNVDRQTISDLGQLSAVSYLGYGTTLLAGKVLQGSFTFEGEDFSLSDSYEIIDFADSGSDMQAVLLEKNERF